MRRIVILIGARVFQDEGAFKELPGAEPDCAAMEKLFRELGFEVVPFYGAMWRGPAVLKDLIQRTVDALNPGDLLVIYAATHGIHRRGDDMLICPESRLVDLEAGDTSQAVVVPWLAQVTARPGVFRVFVFDTCRRPLSGRGGTVEHLQSNARDFVARPLGAAGAGVGVDDVDDPDFSPLSLVHSCSRDNPRAQEVPNRQRGLYSLAWEQVVRARVQAGRQVVFSEALDQEVTREMRNLARQFGLAAGQRPERSKVGPSPVLYDGVPDPTVESGPRSETTSANGSRTASWWSLLLLVFVALVAYAVGLRRAPKPKDPVSTGVGQITSGVAGGSLNGRTSGNQTTGGLTTVVGPSNILVVMNDEKPKSVPATNTPIVVSPPASPSAGSNSAEPATVSVKQPPVPLITKPLVVTEPVYHETQADLSTNPQPRVMAVGGVSKTNPLVPDGTEQPTNGIKTSDRRNDFEGQGQPKLDKESRNGTPIQTSHGNRPERDVGARLDNSGLPSPVTPMLSFDIKAGFLVQDEQLQSALDEYFRTNRFLPATNLLAVRSVSVDGHEENTRPGLKGIVGGIRMVKTNYSRVELKLRFEIKPEGAKSRRDTWQSGERRYEFNPEKLDEGEGIAKSFVAALEDIPSWTNLFWSPIIR